MLIFGLYDGDRISLDVGMGARVGEVRDMIQKQLGIGVDQNKHDKKVLVLTWAGSDLQDSWVFSDLGIVPGTTIRIYLKEEVRPVLHIHCSHSQETLNVYDNMVIGNMPLEELRSLASRKTGLPVGIFRLVNKEGTEMYDGHRLEDYGIDVGHTIHLENLDGWNELLNLAIMGFTPQVISQLSHDEFYGRYQMKVALFLAAHFGHVDLARAMLRQGIKASEPIGYPPQRMWCTPLTAHLESKKAAVHQAVEMGQLGVLRLLVNTDITVIMAPDGDGLRALNIALRKKVKNCARFLLTKQWSKVNITKTFAIHLASFTALRHWCERAKERVFTMYGISKSSLKRRPLQAGPLVGLGVNVDGYSPSIMTGRSKAQLNRDKEKEKKKMAARHLHLPQINMAEQNGGWHDPEAYFRHVTAVQNLKAMGDKVKPDARTRAARAPSKANLAIDLGAARSLEHIARGLRTPEPPRGHAGGGGTGEGGDPFRLPTIGSKTRPHLVVTTSAEADIQTKPSAPSGGDGAERKEEKSVTSKLVMSRSSAFLMTGASSSQPKATAGVKVPLPHLPATEPHQQRAKSRLAELDSHLGTMSVSRRPSIIDWPADTSTITPTLDDLLAPAAQPPKKEPATHKTDPPTHMTSLPNLNKRKSRVSSALLLSKAAASEGAIPLPLVSNELDHRPFVYYNGLREKEFVEPTIKTWAKHSDESGSTPRDRAIRSMSVANTFKEKPWLTQVRIALNIVSSPTKRNVRKLRGAKKISVAT